MTWEIPDKEIALALKNEFDGQDGFLLVQEILETRKEVKHLQTELDKYRWIPVSERLPKNGKAVWLYCKDKITTTGYFDGQWQIYGAKTPRCYYQNIITHWKSIIPPEQGKEKVFLTQEKRVATYRESLGDVWNKEKECWVSKSPILPEQKGAKRNQR